MTSTNESAILIFQKLKCSMIHIYKFSIFFSEYMYLVSSLTLSHTPHIPNVHFSVFMTASFNSKFPVTPKMKIYLYLSDAYLWYFTITQRLHKNSLSTCFLKSFTLRQLSSSKHLMLRRTWTKKYNNKAIKLQRCFLS